MKIKLVKGSKNKLGLIKLIRWFTSLGLKECKNIVDNIPAFFEIKDKNLSFEQIEKNFSSIGAEIKIVESNEPDSPVGSAGIVKKAVKIEKIKAEKPKIKERTSNKNIKEEKTSDFYLKSLNEKADTYALVRGIKTSLSVSFLGSLAYTYSIFYFNFGYYISYFIILAVAISNAIILKNETDKDNTDIAKISAGMTFFFYMLASFIKSVFFSFIYKLGFGISGFIFNIFSSDFIIIILAMGVSYFLVAKKNPIDFIVNAAKNSKSYKTTNKNYTSDKNDKYIRKTKAGRKKKKRF